MPNANIELEKAVDNLIEYRRQWVEAVVKEAVQKERDRHGVGSDKQSRVSRNLFGER